MEECTKQDVLCHTKKFVLFQQCAYIIRKKHDDKEVKFIITIITRYKVYSLTSLEVQTLCIHRYLQLEDQTECMNKRIRTDASQYTYCVVSSTVSVHTR